MDEKPAKEKEPLPVHTLPTPGTQPPPPSTSLKPDRDLEEDQIPGVLPERDLRKNLGCG
jgi:hypothetical protein